MDNPRPNPTAPPLDPPSVARLRAHLRQHNRRVLGLTLMTSSVSIILWLILWVATWWLLIFFDAFTHPLLYQPSPAPHARAFILTALILCLVAWITRRLRPNQAPRDHTPIREHLLDILLALPRLTLSIFGTANAAARLTDPELHLAWTLLRRMDQAQSPIPLQSLPVDIPDPATRDKILLTLQLSDLIELRPTSAGPVLAFPNAQARRLTQDRVRLRF